MRKLHVAAFAAAILVAAGIAPSFADGQAVNVAAVTATIASGSATLATSGTQVADAAMNFGSPPSGEIPILYNDHHVYARPDRLKQNRVLAALVKNGVILVPLRSMFEQMGATVSYNAASKTVTAQKAGASVQVTLGKSEAVINGESRPLDVPPEIYKGVLVVPIRVMSEAMGAYVQWVSDRRLAVVRYIPPTPVPPPPPPPPPPPTLAPTPTPTPKPVLHHGFAQAGYTWGKTYNEFAAGQPAVGQSYVAAGAYEAGDFAFKVDWRQDTWNSTVNAVVPANGAPPCFPSALVTTPPPPGSPITVFNTIDGGVCVATPFKGRDSNIDGRLEYRIWKPANLYIGAAYSQNSNNYGYPTLTGPGGGLEIMPNLDPKGGWAWFASGFDFPSQTGTYTVNDTNSSNFSNVYRVRYNVIKYDVGISYTFSQNFPMYIYGGFGGDRQTGNSVTVKSCVPAGTGPFSAGCPPVTPTIFNHTHSGPYAGVGLKF